MHVVVKLKTGEEVCGKMMIKNENSIELDDAMTMRYHISEDSQSPVMYFTKYCIFTQSFDVRIPNECIMHIFKDPVETMINFYEQELSECKLSYKQNPEPEPPRRRNGSKKNETLIAMMEKLKGDHEVH